MKLRSHGGQFVVAGEWNGNVVSNAMHVQHHMSGIRFGEDAFQKSDHRLEDLTSLTRRQALGTCFSILPFLAVENAFASIEPQWRIWLEAKYMKSQVTSPVEAAQRTVRCAGRWDGTDLTPVTRLDWLASGMSWLDLESAVLLAAASDLQNCSIGFKRDKRNIIECAELQSATPLVSSAVLAPGFASRFSETLGDSLLLTVPSRNKAFVFPKFGPDISRYSDMILNIYRESTYPVSVEVFELRGNSLRCVGILERQR